MVSEDSQDFRWLSMIHRLSDFCDLDETGHRQVPSSLHQTDDLGELLKILSLGSSQSVLIEERNDYVPQVSEPCHDVSREVLPMVVVPSIHGDVATPEETGEVFENILALS